MEKFLSGKDLALWQLLRHGCLSDSGFMKKTCEFQVAPILMLQIILCVFFTLISCFELFGTWKVLLDLDPKSCLDQ